MIGSAWRGPLTTPRISHPPPRGSIAEADVQYFDMPASGAIGAVYGGARSSLSPTMPFRVFVAALIGYVGLILLAAWRMFGDREWVYAGKSLSHRFAYFAGLVVIWAGVPFWMLAQAPVTAGPSIRKPPLSRLAESSCQWHALCCNHTQRPG